MCSHRIFGELWFVELNLWLCCIYVDLMQCCLISIIWSFDSLSIECLHLIWENGARDVLEVGVLEENFYLQRNLNLREWSITRVKESSGSWENSLYNFYTKKLSSTTNEENSLFIMGVMELGWKTFLTQHIFSGYMGWQPK